MRYERYLSENPQSFQKKQYSSRSQRSRHQTLKTSDKMSKSCCEPNNELPPWHETMPSNPSYNLERKIKRRERDRSRSPTAALRQGYHQNYNLRSRNSQHTPNASVKRKNISGSSGIFMPSDIIDLKRSQSSIAASYDNRGYTSMSPPFSYNNLTVS